MGLLLVVLAGYVIWIIIGYQRFTPIEVRIETYIEQEAGKLKNTQERIQALYSKDPLIRSAGIKALTDYPDPVAIGPIIELLKDKQRVRNVYFSDNRGDCGVEALIRIGISTIPYIINEMKTILEEIPNENRWLTNVWEDTLSAITFLPNQYSGYMPAENRKDALQWWVDWWKRSKDIPQVYWRKEALKLNKNRLVSTNYPIRIYAIKSLRQLTGLVFSEIIVNTPPEEYVQIENSKKWQEWFDKYGEIDKWEKWINENYDYLYWSKDQKYFVVNEEAKAKGIPVDPESGQMILPRNKDKLSLPQ